MGNNLLFVLPCNSPNWLKVDPEVRNIISNFQCNITESSLNEDCWGLLSFFNFRANIRPKVSPREPSQMNYRFTEGN